VHAAECSTGCGTTRSCKTCGALTAILSARTGRQDIQECSIIRRKGGGPLTLSVTAVPFKIAGQEFLFFAMLDVTNQKRLRELEKIFFHDILNLTTVIWVSADSLRIGHLEKSREYGEKIYNAVRRLVDEIKSYKDLLQAENQELEVAPQLIRSFDLLKQTAMLYENHVVAKNKVIVIDPRSENISFTSDPNLMQRVLENMLKNALEASGEYQKVVLGSRRAGGEIEFWVHNDGVMPEDVQANVFRRAFSTKEKRRGLGTYSMKLLSENYLSGSVSFESTKDQGTTFIARYPLALSE
jgi:signal transduction histidine kinase